MDADIISPQVDQPQPPQLDNHTTSHLTGVWELDAIIASYFSLSTIQTLTTNYRPTDPHALTIDDTVAEHTLPHFSTQDGLHTLADLLGAGSDPIHNHRIFLTIHTLVSHIVNIQFTPWRRSMERDVRASDNVGLSVPVWDTQPPITDDHHASLMDDLTPYASLLFPPSSRIKRGLTILSDALGPSESILPREDLSILARLLGQDLPTPVYELTVSILADHGREWRSPINSAEKYGMDINWDPWNPNDDPTVDSSRSHLASLDWIFYEVVSHRPDGKMWSKPMPISKGRGYYRALHAMASNATLMSHIWYALVLEVVTVYDAIGGYAWSHTLSDEARASLLALVADAWPQIEEVASSGEGTDYNTMAFESPALHMDLAGMNHYRALEAFLDLVTRPIARCDGVVAPSVDVNDLFGDWGYYGRNGLIKMKEETLVVLRRYNMIRSVKYVGY